MTISTLLKTIVLEHDKHGPFKFEIYLKDNYFYSDIHYRNGDGRWMVYKINFGFSRAQSLEDAEAGCLNQIVIMGK